MWNLVLLDSVTEPLHVFCRCSGCLVHWTRSTHNENEWHVAVEQSRVLFDCKKRRHYQDIATEKSAVVPLHLLKHFFPYFKSNFHERTRNELLVDHCVCSLKLPYSRDAVNESSLQHCWYPFSFIEKFAWQETDLFLVLILTGLIKFLQFSFSCASTSQ